MEKTNQDMRRWEQRTRNLTKVRTRDDDGNPIIEGYFVVFDGIYEIADGMTESIDRGAFDETIDDDIRILIDHDTRLVLGRTSAGTAEVSVDEKGVWGRVQINPNDSDALNAHARAERGDVSQGSFGFDILEEETETREDGSVHWTIKKVKLYELSLVTFPAYEDTAVSARSAQKAEIEKRQHEAWKTSLLKRVKGD